VRAEDILPSLSLDESKTFGSGKPDDFAPLLRHRKPPEQGTPASTYLLSC
jgi:hypothetical protein